MHAHISNMYCIWGCNKCHIKFVVAKHWLTATLSVHLILLQTNSDVIIFAVNSGGSSFYFDR